MGAGVGVGAMFDSNSSTSATRNVVGGLENIQMAGYLMEHGKDLLLHGYIQFKLSNVIHWVDPMCQWVHSHKIAILVTQFVHLSDWLNEQLHMHELLQWLLQQWLLLSKHGGGHADPSSTMMQSYYNYHNTNSPNLPY